jgi:hypothetical protein
MAKVWAEIHGFSSPREYERFCAYIEEQVTSGVARECVTDPSYEKGMVYGGRWFTHVGTNEVWRLLPPDFPFRGLWEKVEPTDVRLG